MKQEEKDLLLKDLCGRLPYGVKLQLYNGELDNDILNSIDAEEYIIINGKDDIETVKPYLFPLSSMTEEQVEKLQEELCNMYDPYHDYDSYENWGVEVLNKHIHSDNYKFTFTSDVIDWLNKNHFDYRGLIEKSLAIDATNLGIYK